MKVIVASPYGETLSYIIRQTGDEPIPFNGFPEEWPEADFAVLYGYRHLVKEPILTKFQYRAINIHLSYLPWNRGADPNFWSWYDNTPKGVTIYYITEMLDHGPIADQQDCTGDFFPDTTLRSSYDHLRAIAILLFTTAWPKIREGGFMTHDVDPRDGSYHALIDRTKVWPEPDWDTPVRDIVAMGRKARGNGA